MYSLTFSIDELNTLLHPTEKHRELKAQELTDRDRISRDIMKDWTKSRLSLWMATNTEFELFRTDKNARNFADTIENLEIIPYIHRTCFSNHKNIELTATLEKESYLTEDDRLRHRTYLSIKIALTR